MNFHQNHWIKQGSRTIEMAPNLLYGFVFTVLSMTYFSVTVFTRYKGIYNAASLVNRSPLKVSVPLCTSVFLSANTMNIKNVNIQLNEDESNSYVCSEEKKSVQSKIQMNPKLIYWHNTWQQKAWSYMQQLQHGIQLFSFQYQRII